MTTLIKQQLTKVVNDLIGNRTRLAEQNAGLQLQLDGNIAQLAHFDTLVAAVKVVIADEDNLEAVAAGITDVNLNLPLAVDPPAPSPLPVAGDSSQPPASTPADGSAGTDGNGSPVPSDTPAAG